MRSKRVPRGNRSRTKRRALGYPKHWSYVHSVEWWKLHWEKTALVDVLYAELLPQSDDLLSDYVLGRPPEQDEDSIMRAVPRDHEGLIALFCLVGRKR